MVHIDNVNRKVAGQGILSIDLQSI